MKKQDKHPIDNYFIDFLEQDYPYNPSSWKKATVIIDNYFSKRKKPVLIVFFFLVTGSITMFLSFNTVEKSIAKMQKNKEIQKKSSPSVYKVKTGMDYPSAPDVAEQNQSSRNSLTINRVETLKVTEKNKTQITEEIPVNITRENQNEIPISIITESPDSSPAKEKNRFYTDFVLHSKPLHSFNFNTTNKDPQISVKKEARKKKFAFMIEPESRFSFNTKQKLSGLTQTEIDYKNKYESIKNTNTYHLNLMFQRGNFALVTGLGYENTIVKTDYLVNKVTYDTRILYKTDYSTVPSSTGKYLVIKTRVDTLSKQTEVSKIENQSDQNTFEYLLVPIKISYQYPHKRFRFSLRTGVDLSWLYNAKGAFVNSDLKSVDLVTYNELKRFNANMFAQFITGYQLNKRFQAGASAYYSQQLGSNFKNQGSRFQNTGLGLYIRMGF